MLGFDDSDLDTAQIEDDVRTLAKGFWGLIGQLSSLKDEDGKPDLDEPLMESVCLAMKMLKHVESVSMLLKGTQVMLDEDVNHLDGASVSTLCRAAWEASVLFSHLAAPGESLDERRCRVDAWKHNAAVRRLRQFGIEELPAVLQDAEGARDQAQARMRDNPAFQSRTAGEQNRLLHFMNWRPGWVEMASNAGVSRRFSETHYSYLCDQAHSGYISILRIFAPGETEEEKVQRFVALGLSCAAIAFASESLMKCESRISRDWITVQGWDELLNAWLVQLGTDAQIQP